MGKKRYRMTPRRRAALKKAQKASARKRRLKAVKSGAKFTGYVVGASAAGWATYGVNKYMRSVASDLAKGVKPRKPWGPPRRRDVLSAVGSPSLSAKSQDNAFPVVPIDSKKYKGMSWVQW